MALTLAERALKIVGTVLTAPVAPLCLMSVKQNWNAAVVRFGKVERVCEPGLRWVAPFANVRDVFVGTQTH